MKAYLFIETGEERSPKRGEYYVIPHSDILVKDTDWEDTPKSILTRHEIEVPDGATAFRYTFICDEPMCNRGQSIPMYIPIPRPKVKVKKWRWHKKVGQVFVTADGFFADQQELEGAMGIPADDWEYIPETMIEVEL